MRDFFLFVGIALTIYYVIQITVVFITLYKLRDYYLHNKKVLLENKREILKEFIPFYFCFRK